MKLLFKLEGFGQRALICGQRLELTRVKPEDDRFVVDVHTDPF